MSGRYDDILWRGRPRLPGHAPLPPASRAAQFAPFAALSGYEDVVEETRRGTQARVTLGEDAEEALQRALCRLLRDGPGRRFSATYFVPDARKRGGAYVTVRGALRRLDERGRALLLEDGARVPLDALRALTLLP